jgi:hypothetical protein
VTTIVPAVVRVMGWYPIGNGRSVDGPNVAVMVCLDRSDGEVADSPQLNARSNDTPVIAAAPSRVAPCELAGQIRSSWRMRPSIRNRSATLETVVTKTPNTEEAIDVAFRVLDYVQRLPNPSTRSFVLPTR